MTQENEPRNVTINDSSSAAPTLVAPAKPSLENNVDTAPKRQSWLRRHLPRGGASKNSSSEHTTKDQKREKESMSDSGPFVFAFDPNTGKEVLQRNPHWPNEDTWKREEQNKGKWAMGGEMGQQDQDFGGTVG